MKKGKTRYRGIRIRGSSIQVDFRYNGIRCRETLIMKPTPTNLRIASDLLGQIRRHIYEPNFNYADHFPNSNQAMKFGHLKPSNLTVSKALDWWMEQTTFKSEGTERSHSENIKNHIKPGVGNIILTKLRPSQVNLWIDTIDLSESTKNNILTPLRSMTRKAYQNEILKKDIMLMIPTITRKKKIKQPLNINEIDAVLNELGEREIKHYYQFAIFTGLATGEQLGLRWGDIDFVNCKINISRILSNGKVLKTKNNHRDREVELLNPAYISLNELAPDDYFKEPNKYSNDYIFINPLTKKVWGNDSVNQHWKKTLKKCNISHRSPYETRHTFASLMVTACLPDGWIRAQMGHATMKMLEEVYGKWTGDPDKVIQWLSNKTKTGKNGKSFVELFLKRHS